MLYLGSKGIRNISDLFKILVINIIIAEIQNIPGENQYVFLLGYKK
jgi:hypothetical protein